MKYSEQEQKDILQFKSNIDDILLMIETELNKRFEKEQRWLALGRLTNSMVLISYRPMFIEILKEGVK